MGHRLSQVFFETEGLGTELDHVAGPGPGPPPLILHRYDVAITFFNHLENPHQPIPLALDWNSPGLAFTGLRRVAAALLDPSVLDLSIHRQDVVSPLTEDILPVSPMRAVLIRVQRV